MISVIFLSIAISLLEVFLFSVAFVPIIFSLLRKIGYTFGWYIEEPFAVIMLVTMVLSFLRFIFMVRRTEVKE